ncbi:MAG: hypothetical protein HY975_01030 [Candidatus Kerfeldbacteria bacterium]|nr:hypothetical protein [Candidatus Kerfeldbacteria bacterium]
MAWWMINRRKVPRPELIGPHKSSNPMFAEGSPEHLALFRQRVLSALALVFVVGAAVWLVYGPWFRITTVAVTGTRIINPTSLQRVTERYVDGRRWYILPNRTLWVLSAGHLTKTLEKQIRQRLSIELVTVVKQRPHTLKIVVAERTPVATWYDGRQYATVDRHGVIIDLQAAAIQNLPLITDENEQAFGVDSSVVKQEVISAILGIERELTTAKLKMVTFLIPVPTCPITIEQIEPESTNANTNQSSVNINATANTNATVSQTNRNSNTNTTRAVQRPCDLQELKYSSQEVHVQLQDGPRVLFDRHGDVAQAVQSLTKVLKQPQASPIHTIDVRFGERVYVQ